MNKRHKPYVLSSFMSLYYQGLFSEFFNRFRADFINNFATDLIILACM